MDSKESKNKHEVNGIRIKSRRYSNVNIEVKRQLHCNKYFSMGLENGNGD